MTKVGPQPAEVLIIRSAYSTEGAWLAAIRQARRHSRAVVSIDFEGQRWRLDVGPVSDPTPEADDW